MALRESSRALNIDVNLEALVRPNVDVKVPGGDLLLAFANAVVGSDHGAMNKARAALADGLGPVTVAGAAAVAANFTKNDRIANGLGIPSEMAELTVDIREQLGLDNYRSAVNTLKTG
jgi:hypothetical protein